MSAAIELRGLTKFYGRQRGIEDLSFTVDEGEIFGFIGPNGAGKSTTIRTMLALLRPTKGSASIFGKDCQKSAHIIAHDTGYVPSEAAYYDKIRVRELLDYTAKLYHMDCAKKTAELCSRLSLDPKRKIADLSFGNKKKVGIVSALLHSPKLIILDEPTAGLDPLAQQTFFDIIREENARGATVFFSSHILSEVQKSCKRVAILKDGHLAGLKTVSELRESGYKKVIITAKSPVPPGYFETAAGLEADGARVTFLYEGDINLLFKKIAGLSVEDALIEEPSLEEIFLHYYK